MFPVSLLIVNQASNCNEVAILSVARSEDHQLPYGAHLFWTLTTMVGQIVSILKSDLWPGGEFQSVRNHLRECKMLLGLAILGGGGFIDD